MRLNPIFIATCCTVALATPVGDRQWASLSGPERAFQRSMQLDSGLRYTAVEEKIDVPMPYILYNLMEESSSLPIAHAGEEYTVHGVLHQLTGMSDAYKIEVEGLPEGAELISAALQNSPKEERILPAERRNAFQVRLRLSEGITPNAYPFTIRVLNGSQEVAVSNAVIPVDTLVDVIRIAAYNDFHGYIIPQGNAANGFTGAFSMTLKLEELRNELAEKDMILVAAGDTIGGTLFESAINNDDPTKRITKLWDTRAQGVGNHEFDRGWEDLLAAKEIFQFPQLGANIRVRATGEPFLDATHIETINRGGQDYKIGFVGVTLESLPNVVVASATEPLEFLPAGPVAAEHAARLKNVEGCDVVICLFHQGGLSSFSTKDAYMAGTPNAELTGFLQSINQDNKHIDILMTGHTHHLYNWNEQSVVNPNLPPVMQTGAFAVNIASFDLFVDRGTRAIVQAPDVSVSTVRQPITYDFDQEIWVRGTTPLTPAEVAALPERLMKVFEEVAVAKEDADLKGLTRQGRSDVYWPRPTRIESILGAHIADAMLNVGIERDQTVTMSMTNDGGIRKEWEPIDGYILVRHVFDTLPFSNSAVAMNLTGSQLKAILEEQWFENRNPFVLQVSGLRYEFDSVHNPVGNRVDAASMEHFDHNSQSWRRILPNETYRVVTNNFLSGGGDNFASFLLGTNVEDLGAIDNDYTMAYNEAMAAENDGWIVPPVFERAINKNVDMSRAVDVQVKLRVDGVDRSRSTIQLMTGSAETIPGPFRAVLYNHETGHSEVKVAPEGFAISPASPLEVTFDLEGQENNELSIVLYHTQFDESPLPRGIERKFRYDREGTSDASATLQFTLFATILGIATAIFI